MMTRRRFFKMLGAAVAAIAGLPKLVEAAKAEKVGHWQHMTMTGSCHVYHIGGLPVPVGNPWTVRYLPDGTAEFWYRKDG